MFLSRPHLALIVTIILAITACTPRPSGDAPPTTTPTPAPAHDPIAAVHLRRAENQIAQGRLDTARRELEQALELEPDLGRAHLLLGRVHYLQARYKEAIARLEHAREVDGASVELLDLLGESYLQRAEFEPAEETYLELLELEPEHAEATKRLAMLYVQIDQKEKALAALERARKLAPNDLELVLQHGTLLRDTNQLASSAELLRRAVEIAPESARAAYELGMTFKRTGADQDAVRSFKAALEGDAMHEGALYQLAQAARVAGDREAQESYLERYEKAHEIAESERDLRSGLEHQPYRTDLLHRLAGLALERDRQAEAASLFARILLLNPNDVAAARQLGRAQMRLGKAAEAVSAFLRAIELEPQQPLHRIEVAEAYLGVQDTERATEHIERAEQLIGPAAADSAERGFLFWAIAQLYQRAGRPEDARRTQALAGPYGRNR